MASRLSGRFTITSAGTGTQTSGTITGVQGTFADPAGNVFATDVTVGDLSLIHI